MTWRIVATSDLDEATKTPDQRERLEVALDQWREYLLDEAGDPGPCEHHIFVLDVVAQASAGIPEGTHTYLLRAVDATVARSKTHLAVYVKLPRFIIWASVEPPHTQGWEGTHIDKEGVLAPPQHVMEPGFGQFLLDRIRTVTEAVSKMSARQQQVIEQMILSDPERVVASDTFLAIEADRHWQEHDPREGP